jgi:anti-anti-sigma factor
MADVGSSKHDALTMDVRDENGTVAVFLSGELDMTGVVKARAAIDAALGGHPRRVILYASGLNYMDSSGIALLVLLIHKAQEVQVRNPTPIVRQLIEMTGLSEILHVSNENQP